MTQITDLTRILSRRALRPTGEALVALERQASAVLLAQVDRSALPTAVRELAEQVGRWTEGMPLPLTEGQVVDLLDDASVAETSAFGSAAGIAAMSASGRDEEARCGYAAGALRHHYPDVAAVLYAEDAAR